jgi:hypothetical protein
MRRREWLNLGKGLLLTAAATSLGVAQQRGKKPIYVLESSKSSATPSIGAQGVAYKVPCFETKQPQRKRRRRWQGSRF